MHSFAPNIWSNRKLDGGRPKSEKKVHFVDNGKFRKGYEKFERDILVGRTVKKLVQDATSRTRPKIDVDGGRQPSRYLLFHIPIVLEKKMHFVDNGRFRKGYEKVVVRELDVRSDLWKNLDTEVLAR